MGCNALTLGNNEFKTSYDLNAQKHLSDRINQAKFPVLCANIRVKKDDSFLPKVKPYTVITLGGVKIGIIGVTTSRVASYPQTMGFVVEDPILAVRKIFPKVKAESNLVLALTHIGIDDDIALAKSWLMLSAIIGGDSHSVLEKPIVKNNIPVVQAGDCGRFLGRLDLYFELIEGDYILKKYTGGLIPIDETLPEDPEIRGIIKSFMDTLEKDAA